MVPNVGMGGNILSTPLSERLAPLKARMSAQRSIVRPVSRVWFELSDTRALEVSIDLCLRWMQPRAKVPLPPSARQREAFDVSDVLGANPCRAVRIDASDGVLWAGRLDFPDQEQPRTWVTEFFAERRSGMLSRFGAQLTCVVRGESPPYEITRPTVARHVIEKLSAEADGRQLTETVTRMNCAEIDEFVTLAYNSSRRLPIIAISETETGETLISPNLLASKVAGAAHIFHLSGEASWELTRAIGKRMSTFNGAVRLYLPGLTEEQEDPYRHPLWLYREETDDRLISALTGRVLPSAFLRPEASSEFPRFSFVRELALRRPIPTVHSQHNTVALREENVSLAAQIEQTNEDLDVWHGLAQEEERKRLNADAEIERLKAENARLTAKAHALEHQFRDRAGSDVPTAPTDRQLESYDDLEDWSEEVLGEHVLIHQAALKDCKKNGHVNMLSRIANVMLVIRDHWIPAKLNGGNDRWQNAKAKLTELGVEDSHCFVDCEEAKRTVGYSVQYEGEARVLYDHLKYGNGYDNANQIRIYYFWDDERKCFVIGKMPSHLKNHLTS